MNGAARQHLRESLEPLGPPSHAQFVDARERFLETMRSEFALHHLEAAWRAPTAPVPTAEEPRCAPTTDAGGRVRAPLRGGPSWASPPRRSAM